MDQSQEFVPAYEQTRITGMNTGFSLHTELEQQGDPEPYQGWTLEPCNGPPSQATIEFRIKQLHNRRFFLLKMQHFRKREEDDGVRTTEEMTCEDDDKLCELEAIQKELEELLLKKEEVNKQEKRFRLRANAGHQDKHFCKTETPRGGIYMLPVPHLTQEDITVKTRTVAERPTGPVIPVDSLGPNPEITRCPSCEEVVFTETRRTVGEATWMCCCLCALTGCVAGCCIIPFFMSRLKSVHHQCPQCRANIHTHRPF